MGFSVHALRSKAKMGGVGEIAADGKGAGASATRTFGGFWLDAQVQATGPKAKIDSAASGKLENDATGKSRALGLEAGRRMPIAGGAFLTPRLGFSWTSADLDDFTDSIRPNPTRVSVEKARSVRGRAGITLAAPAGDARLFGTLDIEREFADETSVEISDATLRTKVEATAARVVRGGLPRKPRRARRRHGVDGGRRARPRCHPIPPSLSSRRRVPPRRAPE